MVELENADLQSLGISSTDDAAVRAQLQRISTRFAEARDVAPEAIRADVELLADFVTELERVARETNSRDAFERSAALLEVQSAYEAELGAATDRYNSFVARSCTPAP